MTDDKGRRFALQSYKIYDPDLSDRTCTIAGCSAKPGEEQNICSYLDSRALDKLPKGWSVTCGVLKEEVWCGLQTCTNIDVITDTYQLGTWCLVDVCKDCPTPDVCDGKRQSSNFSLP